jgi:DNA polymerase
VANADLERPGAQAWVPERPTITALRAAAPRCRGCELWAPATQVVFSSGPAAARVVMVGEQPGDHEDREGQPFVGPAGRILDRAIDEAGLDRREVYLTNAVKHFRFRLDRSGKRRIHEKPSVGHVVACQPWLDAELDLIDPDLTVALGATAARAIIGPGFRVTKDRGRVLEVEQATGPRSVVATVHPSSVLRARDDRDAAFAGLVADLAVVAAELVRGESAR